MKFIFVLSPLFASALSFVSAKTCLNISGIYESPNNSESNKTTYIYSQSGCDALTVGGTLLQVPGGVAVLPSKTYSMNGVKPSDCGNSISDTCAAYSPAPTSIAKTLVASSWADGNEHGACVYTDSVLELDVSGNLLETISGVGCEDGYTGPLTPTVYQKTK